MATASILQLAVKLDFGPVKDSNMSGVCKSPELFKWTMDRVYLSGQNPTISRRIKVGSETRSGIHLKHLEMGRN